MSIRAMSKHTTYDSENLGNDACQELKYNQHNQLPWREIIMSNSQFSQLDM